MKLIYVSIDILYYLDLHEEILCLQEFSPLVCGSVRGDCYVSSPTFFENKYGKFPFFCPKPHKKMIKQYLMEINPWRSSLLYLFFY